MQDLEVLSYGSYGEMKRYRGSYGTYQDQLEFKLYFNIKINDSGIIPESITPVWTNNYWNNSSSTISNSYMNGNVLTIEILFCTIIYPVNGGYMNPGLNKDAPPTVNFRNYPADFTVVDITEWPCDNKLSTFVQYAYGQVFFTYRKSKTGDETYYLNRDNIPGNNFILALKDNWNGYDMIKYGNIEYVVGSDE